MQKTSDTVEKEDVCSTTAIQTVSFLAYQHFSYVYCILRLWEQNRDRKCLSVGAWHIKTCKARWKCSVSESKLLHMHCEKYLTIYSLRPRLASF